MSASRGRIIPADRPVVAVPGADAGTASPVQAAPATAASAADKTWFGVAVQPVTGKDMRIMHMEYGRWPVVFVSEVAKDSPAGKIGIRLNDIILSSLSVCSAEQPNPEIWEPLQYNSFYNKKIITKSPGILLVWTYRIITDEARANRIEEVKKYAPEKSIKYKEVHHETVLWEMNCANRLIRMEEIIDFDKNGKVLDRHRDMTIRNG